RAAEADQRQRADREAAEARKQAKVAEDRRKETQQIADFQGSLLKDIDLQTMGVALRKRMLSEAAAAMKQAQCADAEGQSRLAKLEEAIAGTNWTNIARDELESNIFDRALRTVDKQFGDQALVRAQLLSTLSETMQELGLLDRAFEAQKQALAIHRRELG